MAERKAKTKTRRRERKNVPFGHVHVQASFNNTIVTITDPAGGVISWGSAGVAGFKSKEERMRLYLKPGDVMEAEIERIGVLRNPVVSWQEAHGTLPPPRVRPWGEDA